MAEAYGKLTGRPGVCLVTRGPGATHAAVGVHTAFQDSTPLVLLVGQVASDQEEREAFQEIDYRRMFGPMAKWVAQIDRPDRIPELVARAFSTACAGRPGPVVLALPEDVLAAESRRRGRATLPPRSSRARAHEDIAELERLLASAERPLAILGGEDGRRRRPTHMAAFLAANELPAGAAFRRQDTLDNDDPRYVGDVGIGINPEARAARPRCRPAARRRPAAGGDDDLRLHAARRSRAEADARARPPGRGGARSRLPAGAADPLRRRSRSPRPSPSCG